MPSTASTRGKVAAAIVSSRTCHTSSHSSAPGLEDRRVPTSSLMAWDDHNEKADTSTNGVTRRYPGVEEMALIAGSMASVDRALRRVTRLSLSAYMWWRD